jgi:hypothetical protein
MWKERDIFAKDDATYKLQEDEYYRFKLLWEKKWVNATDESVNAKPVEMPKTYDMGADLAQKALAKAKTQFSFNVDKVVFTSNQWNEFKEQKYPYRVMHRSIDVALLTKVGDKWMIRYYYLKQASNQNGGWTDNYGFEIRINDDPKPVNYKP